MEIERINFVNSRNLILVGDFYKAESKKGIILCHGFTGDRHEGGKFDMLAKKLHEAGFNVLTFDFSGSGESDDEALNTNNQAQDFLDAVKYMKSRGVRRLGAVGMSLGPIAILKNKKMFGEEIETLVLWCPVTDKKERYRNDKFSKGQVEELERTGYIHHRKIREGRPRYDFVISEQVIKERETLNQKELLERVSLPILIIQGDEDKTIPMEWSKTAIEFLPKGSRLEIIAGAGHTFDGYEGEVVEKTVGWFLEKI